VSNIWFTSDLHLGHHNVITYDQRPFLNVNHMREVLIARWNNVVKPGDTVYVLGDYSLHPRELHHLPLFNGMKHLISGNHDHCHPAHYRKRVERGERMRQLYLDSGFRSVQTELDLTLPAGTSVTLHHMPYRGDSSEQERYLQYRPVDKGGWLLHGHVHTAWQFAERMINVGVMHWDYTPINADVLERIILDV
jgi:calcineurin-like phosphoesterase family protein